jgi:acylphosphatase
VSPSRSPLLIRKRVVVHGLVQGVFFRESTRRAAEEAGVAGWVRNLLDGVVEVVLEGRTDAVAQVVAFCRVGPSDAEVTRLEVFDEVPLGEVGFTVRLTPPRDP